MSHHTCHLLAAILVCILAVLIFLWFAERQMKEYGQQGDEFLAPWDTKKAVESLYQQTVFGDIVQKDYTDPFGAPDLREAPKIHRGWKPGDPSHWSDEEFKQAARNLFWRAYSVGFIQFVSKHDLPTNPDAGAMDEFLDRYLREAAT